MAGYYQNRMSNNAVAAYSNDEMPKTKWTKSAIIEQIELFACANDIDITDITFNKLTLKELQQEFLSSAGWHHTGSFYNATSFYKINEDRILNFTQEDLIEIIGRRSRVKKSETERDQESKEKRALEEAKIIYKKLEVIIKSNITGLKTSTGVINRYMQGSIELDDVYAAAIEKIQKEDQMKVEQWKKLPQSHWRHESVRLYEEDIEQYVKNVLDIHDNEYKQRKMLDMIKQKVSKTL